MAKIHLVGGEKGGVGKSFFTKVLLEYCRLEEKQIEIDFIDADRTNPDVGLIYEPEKYRLFLEDNPEKSNGKIKQIYFTDNFLESYLVDKIFEKALTKTVIVNLPPQVTTLVNNWIDKQALLALGESKGITFVHWFVCSGEYHSIRLFKKSVSKYGDKIPHVLVRNNGLCLNWSHLLEDVELAELIRQDQIKVIDLPALGDYERNLIDAKQWTFSTALNEASIEILGQHKISIFLEEAFQEISKGEKIVSQPESDR